jgi:multiple sugar transport system permease protein
VDRSLTEATPAPSRGRRSFVARHRAALTGLVFIAPAAIFLALVMGYPLVYLIRHSLNKENFANPAAGATFIGLGNYRALLTNHEFWQSTRTTLVIVVFAVAIEFLLGMLLALLLQRVLRGRRILIALVLIPSMMMPIAVGLMWRFMLDDGYGMVTYYLGRVGLTGPHGLFTGSILGSAHSALASIVLTDVWEWTPFMALILLAGLQSLPTEPYEAAAVDGASGWQEFFWITLPMLRAAITVALLIRIADAMRILDIVFSMTNGGPANATQTAQLFTYRTGFEQFNIGLAFAQVVLVVGVTIAVCALIFRQVARDEGGA